ncbi:MAG: hypothetical protein ACI81Y_002745 [Glaciecola sp.]
MAKSIKNENQFFDFGEREMKKKAAANKVYTASQAMRLTCAYTKPLVTIRKKTNSKTKFFHNLKTNIMKRLTFSIILLTVLTGTTLFSQSQTLINKVWEESFGQPDEYNWAASTIDQNGNLITVGHSTISSTSTKLLLKKQDEQGVSLWESQFETATNTKNYGTAIAIDNSGNIFVTGVNNIDGSVGKNDFLLLKYDSNGNALWNKTIDGSGQGDDIPVDIILDNFGFIYITGVSLGVNSEMDYFTLKLNPINGSTIWENRYDYSNYFDIPVDISFDNLGNILVTGGSAQNQLNWEIAVVKYSPTGVFIEDERISNQSLEFNMPSGLSKDNDGNIYITGTTSPNGTNFNIRTLKLSNDLNLQWIQDYDSGSNIDSVSTIQTDPSGNIIVTGWMTNSNGGTEFITLKYDTNGNQLWKRKRTANPSTSFAKSTSLAVDQQGNIFIAGEVKNDDHSYISVIQYDSNGNTKWEKRLKEEQHSFNIPISIDVNDAGEILIVGISKEENSSNYTSFKLIPYERELIPVIEDNQESHIANEIVIRFKPDIIDGSFIDNRDLRFSKVEDVILDQGCLNDIEQKLQTSGTFKDWPIIKVHRNLTRADSVATTFSGKTIRVPDFYNTFIVVVPRNYDRIRGEFAISDSLKSKDLMCCLVTAEPNFIFSPDLCDPNDDLYETQGHLHPTTSYPDGHINMEPAWCIDEGKDHIRVAIMGTGVKWDHEDFNGPTFEDSVIDGGYDYTTNQPIENNPDNDNWNHETKVASIDRCCEE